jgi:hypothetical protein
VVAVILVFLPIAWFDRASRICQWAIERRCRETSVKSA